MTTQTLAQATRTSALVTMSTLAANNYIASSAIDLGATIPLDVTLEVVATATSPAGNKQIVVFIKCSLDNTNWGSGPESGSTVTDEPNLIYVGALPVNTSATAETKHFSLAGLPVTRYIKIVCKNDLGVALTSGFVYRGDITGSSA